MMKARLEVPALKENLSQVISFVGEHLEEIGCGMKLQMQLETAVEEIFINIASYAYPEKQGTAVIELSCENGTAQITFTDQGIPFDPLARTDPDTTLPAEERPIGGLGILMVKKMMDKVTYRRENGCNILSIQKKIQ